MGVTGTGDRERADAARNRQRILEAAERLFAENSVERVSMDAIAVAAGVGKGTLFRRFGDRAGLIRALLELRYRDLRCAVLEGPPPLGPGAPPCQRLRAFIEEAAVLACRSSAWLVEYEASCGATRYSDEHYRFWYGHVASLVAAVRPDADAAFLAHALLGPLTGDLVHHLVVDRGMSHQHVRDGAVALVEAALGSRDRELRSGP